VCRRWLRAVVTFVQPVVQDARQDLLDTLAELQEDLANTKPSKKKVIRELKQQILDVEREIEVRCLNCTRFLLPFKH